jgi:beta-glucosidase
LNTWFAGSEAGNAIADVLFGDENPSGKLTATFPRSDRYRFITVIKNTGRPLGIQKENLKNSNLIISMKEMNLYFLFFGLSYTTFDYSNLKSSDKMNFDGKISASVDVTNTGNYDGKEIVQLYTRDLVGSVTRPLKELKGFQKIILRKGEKRQSLLKFLSKI